MSNNYCSPIFASALANACRHFLFAAYQIDWNLIIVVIDLNYFVNNIRWVKKHLGQSYHKNSEIWKIITDPRAIYLAAYRKASIFNDWANWVKAICQYNQTVLCFLCHCWIIFSDNILHRLHFIQPSLLTFSFWTFRWQRPPLINFSWSPWMWTDKR